MSEGVTCFFSLRSPYSWLALHRLSKLGPRLGVPLELVPVYPKAPGGNVPDPAANLARFRYTVEDCVRISNAYGLAMRPPSSLDTRWELPHAATQWAISQGHGLAFALAAASARFTRSRDLGEPEVIGEVATLVGLDPDAAVAAARDARWQTKVDAGIARAQQQGVCGVPFFVFQDGRYFGNDRIDWLLRAVDASRGLPVADLSGGACLDPAWRPGPG